MELPAGLNIEKLPGLKRGQHPAIYFRDEIAWNTDESQFALAYTICEASFGNEIGHICWGRSRHGKIEVQGSFGKIFATCWQTPWCTWINRNTFSFKGYFYNGNPTPPDVAKVHLPIVAVHFSQGSLVLAGTDNTESRPDREALPSKAKFKVQSEKALIQEILKDQQVGVGILPG